MGPKDDYNHAKKGAIDIENTAMHDCHVFSN